MAFAETTVSTATTDHRQSHPSDKETRLSRLYIDLGFGETSSVQTDEWDWFKRPAELTRGVGSAAVNTMATHGTQSMTDAPKHVMPHPRLEAARSAPGPVVQPRNRHRPTETSSNPYEIIARLGYDRPMLGDILQAIRPMEISRGQQVTSITQGRVGGFIRGMMESAIFAKERAQQPPTTAIEKDRLFGPKNVHAPQSDASVAPYYPLARNRALNARYRKSGFKAKVDAALQDVGWAHEIAEEVSERSRVERIAMKVKSKVRTIAQRFKLAAVTRLEQRHIKAHDAELQRTWSKLPPLAFFDRNPHVDTMPDWQPPADVVANQKILRVDNELTEFRKGSTYRDDRAESVFEPALGVTINIEPKSYKVEPIVPLSRPVYIPGQRTGNAA